LSNRGRATKVNIANPESAERVNIPKEANERTPVSEKAFATKKKTPMGKNFMTR
jgi:hypothetical protein